MILGHQLDAVLVPGPVRAESEGVVAEVDVTDVDRLGARVTGIRVHGTVRGDVVEQAARLPEAVRMLPDRVVAVEVDRGLGGAVLRSDPRDMVDREYFEVRTDGRTASIERRSVDGPGRVPFTVTREQLGRLVDGLGEVLGDDDE